MANGVVKERTEAEPRPAVTTLPPKDVRAPESILRSPLLRWETARRLIRIGTLCALDVAALVLAIGSAAVVRTALLGHVQLHDPIKQTGQYAPIACLVTILLFALAGLYGDRAVRPGFAKIVAALFQVTVVVLAYTIVQGQHFSSYYIFYGSFTFAVLYVTLFRVAFERISGAILRAAGYHRRTVLVGTGSQIVAVAHALTDGTHSEIEPVGFVSLTPLPGNGLKDLGPLEELDRHFDEIDEVLIADPDFPQNRAVELVDRCHAHGIRVCVAPSTMEILMERVDFVPGQTLPLFELKPPVFEGVDFFMKRTFDVVAAGAIGVILVPFGLLVALMIKLTSRGPVIYRSVRAGTGGAPFACFKFRTMYADADRLQAELEAHNEKRGAIFKIRRDPRVTPVGRFLRRWSIDELPQLLNVLRGEMSLVGPRPLTVRDYERLEEWHRKRNHILPGITGLWQVSGRSELDFDELVRLDFLYLEGWSIFLDLTILLKTIPAVIRARGAW